MHGGAGVVHWQGLKHGRHTQDSTARRIRDSHRRRDCRSFVRYLPLHRSALLHGRLTTQSRPLPEAKNRRRVIPINPTLRAWLRVIELRRIPFFPKNAVEKIRRVRKTVLRQTRAGCVPKCANMARRSYINYRLALPEASFAGVGQEAGNREPTLRKFYRRPTTRAAAREFWALTPRRIGVTAL